MKDADSKFIAAWEEYTDTASLPDAMSIITGIFVGLFVSFAEQNGVDLSKPVVINGGAERDITIHPPKEEADHAPERD